MRPRGNETRTKQKTNGKEFNESNSQYDLSRREAENFPNQENFPLGKSVFPEGPGKRNTYLNH